MIFVSNEQKQTVTIFWYGGVQLKVSGCHNDTTMKYGIIVSNVLLMITRKFIYSDQCRSNTHEE